MSAEPQPGKDSTGASGQSNMPFRLDAMLEPKGFIRVLEFVLAICMFATTAGYNSMFSFEITCGLDSTQVRRIDYAFFYPFSFTDPIRQVCGDDFYIEESPAGAAKFFVAVGVFAMLYCIASVIWYVVLEVHFLKWEFMPLVDLITTAVFTLLFFIASCAWAAGVGTVKYWTNFENLQEKLACSGSNSCTSVQSASYGALTISILFGFLNTVVWGGNIWFVWKETSWFRDREAAKDAGVTKMPENQS